MEEVYCEKYAFQLYNVYAYAGGFIVHRGEQYYQEGTKIIRLKYYYCSNQGWKEVSEKTNNDAFNQLDTRTECNAMVAFVVDKMEDGNLNHM